MLVDVAEERVEVYHRAEAGGSFVREVYGPGTELLLPSLELRVPVAELYALLRAEEAAEAAE